MRENIKKKALNSTQRFLLAYQTCQWWNTVFIQADRFFEVLEKSHGGTPWDAGDANSLFMADRMFLITAIHHAIENLEKLDNELQRDGDSSLQSVLEAIEKIAPLADIKNLRDMNVHNLDYLMDEGKKQNQYFTSVTKNGFKILTTAAWTIIHGDAQTMLLGNVEIDKLLKVMMEQLPYVRKKTKTVFNKEVIN